jgi:hypothetical protein
MNRRTTYWRSRLLLGSLFSLTQCHVDVGTEQEQVVSQDETNNVEVTSFNIERENSPALADWIAFEDGKERICTPPGWKSHITIQHELVITPMNSKDNIEQVYFTRFARGIKPLNDDTIALNLAKAAFNKFSAQKADTLKKLTFQQDFGYERNTALLANGLTYKGYCIVYVDDSLVYKFRIILSDNRLRNYKGNLFSDIIGNLQINKHYIMDNKNPLKNINYIK